MQRVKPCPRCGKAAIFNSYESDKEKETVIETGSLHCPECGYKSDGMIFVDGFVSEDK